MSEHREPCQHCEAMRKALEHCRDVLENTYGRTEWPATSDCKEQLAYDHAIAALASSPPASKPLDGSGLSDVEDRRIKYARTAERLEHQRELGKRLGVTAERYDDSPGEGGDDEEPISDKWLRSIGVNEHGYLWWRAYTGMEMGLRFRCDADFGWVVPILMLAVKNRGHVRQLCACLNIPLQESPTESQSKEEA